MVQMFLFLFSFFCGTYAVKYLRISDYGFIWFGISILIYLAFRKGAAGIRRVSYMTFSAVLSAALVAGYHLRLDGDMYTGLMYENDLTGFSFCDLAAWVILAIVTAAGLQIFIPFLEKNQKSLGFPVQLVYAAKGYGLHQLRRFFSRGCPICLYITQGIYLEIHCHPLGRRLERPG